MEKKEILRKHAPANQVEALKEKVHHMVMREQVEKNGGTYSLPADKGTYLSASVGDLAEFVVDNKEKSQPQIDE